MCGRKLAPCRTGLDLCRPLLRCSSPSLFVDKQKMERIIHRWICERWFDPTSWLSRLNLKAIWIDSESLHTQGPGWFPGTPRLGDLSFVPEVTFCHSMNSKFWKSLWNQSLQAMTSDSYPHINNFVLRIRSVRNTTQSTRACSTCTRLPIFLLPTLPFIQNKIDIFHNSQLSRQEQISH